MRLESRIAFPHKTHVPAQRTAHVRREGGVNPAKTFAADDPSPVARTRPAAFPVPTACGVPVSTAITAPLCPCVVVFTKADVVVSSRQGVAAASPHANTDAPARAPHSRRWAVVASRRRVASLSRPPEQWSLEGLASCRHLYLLHVLAATTTKIGAEHLDVFMASSARAR